MNSKNETMKITLLYFAQLKEDIGLAQEVLELEETAPTLTGKGLLHLLGEQYPVIQLLAPSLSMAVNEEYWPQDEAIPDGATVALIPPVSGG